MPPAIHLYHAKDFVETSEGLIFAVVQPGTELVSSSPKVLCFLRYVKADSGKGWCKIETAEANSYLQKKYPGYLHHSAVLDADVHAVDVEAIIQHHQPRSRLQVILGNLNRDAIERDVVDLCLVLQENGIDPSQIGVTGSLLIGQQQQQSSDIDLVVYDRDLFHQIREVVEKLINNGQLGALSEKNWQEAYSRRACQLSYKEYVWHERRKFNKGLINNRKFDLSFVHDHACLRGGAYRKLAAALIRAQVIDDLYGFDYPASFQLNHTIIKSVVCFTATYNGQARAGETIEVAGLLEQADNGEQRVVVGSSREAPGEYVKVIKS